MKVNKTSTSNTPRAAIMGKICNELISLGVQGTNIIIYDTHAYPDDECINATYGPYVGNTIPAGVRTANGAGTDKGLDGMGGLVSVMFPGLTASSSGCPRYLGDDSDPNKIDILINFGVNKGNSGMGVFGQFTHTLKNHFGTLAPDHSNLSYLFAVNQNYAILGNGSPCRQQLAIVDSLWGQIWGPGYLPSYANPRLNTIVMGTFSPAVDYLTAKEIRIGLMDVNNPNVKDAAQAVCMPIDTGVLAHFCTDWGYAESDPLWLNALDSVVSIDRTSHQAMSKGTVRVSGPRIASPATLAFDSGQGSVTVGVLTVDGRFVRELGLVQSADMLSDTRDSGGRMVPAGVYIVKAASGSRFSAATVIVR